MRIYVPATITQLQQLVGTGELPVLGGTAFALTPALREAYRSGGDEELEFAAMTEAARASLRLLAAEFAAAESTTSETLPARRAVVAAEVAEVSLHPELEPAVVKVSTTVPQSAIAAVHIDDDAAEQAVREAVAAVDQADMGDMDAEFVVGEAEDHQLSWFAPQELGFVLELL